MNLIYIVYINALHNICQFIYYHISLTFHLFVSLVEGMENWDQETLEDVVKKKHGASNQNKTDIVSIGFVNFDCKEDTSVFGSLKFLSK